MESRSEPPKCGDCFFPMLRKIQDTTPAHDRRGVWRWVFPKRVVRVLNCSDFKGYVIISPTQQSDVSKVNIHKVVEVNTENNGVTIQNQRKPLEPMSELLFSIETKKVYVTVFIEIDEDRWICWRENIYVNACRDDFIIKKLTDKDLKKVIGASYTYKEFMELLKKKIST